MDNIYWNSMLMPKWGLCSITIIFFHIFCLIVLIFIPICVWLSLIYNQNFCKSCKGEQLVMRAKSVKIDVMSGKKFKADSSIDLCELLKRTTSCSKLFILFFFNLLSLPNASLLNFVLQSVESIILFLLLDSFLFYRPVCTDVIYCQMLDCKF